MNSIRLLSLLPAFLSGRHRGVSLSSTSGRGLLLTFREYSQQGSLAPSVPSLSCREQSSTRAWLSCDCPPPVTGHSRSINIQPSPITPEFPTRLAGPVWDLQSRFFPPQLDPVSSSSKHPASPTLSQALLPENSKQNTHVCVPLPQSMSPHPYSS